MDRQNVNTLPFHRRVWHKLKCWVTTHGGWRLIPKKSRGPLASVCAEINSLHTSEEEPFVFLGVESSPYLAFRGWLHYWNEGTKGWVTLRELRPGERGVLESLKLPDDQSALYGWPCDKSQPRTGP